MTRHATTTVRAMASLAVVAVTILGFCIPAARADAKPTAVVSMGDSYISGEAGRWAGNSVSPTPGNDGTDRACVPIGPVCQVDKSRVYVGGSDVDGCHRSDVAEVIRAQLAVDRRINISCSGAVTSDLLTTAEGGTSDHGEAPQGDQLARVARDNDVKAIVVSIGGNDLGFAGIIADCLQAYAARTGPCKPTEQPKLAAAIPAATQKVAHVIDSIRGVMRDAGYQDGSYRLILQGYPSVAPRAAENRYTENDPRRVTDGCANYDIDLDWARDEASAEIDGMVAAAARSRGAEYLDLHDLFQGHEVCAKTVAESTPLAQPSAQMSEWGRFVGGSTAQEGDLQEAFHPNAFGQQAFGACLTATYAASAPGRFMCSSSANRAPAAVAFKRTATLDSLPGLTGPPPSLAKQRRHLKLGVHHVHRARRQVCLRFTARSGHHRVRGARIGFAGRHRRADRHGRTVVCGHFKSGRRYRASVRKAGYRTAHRSFRVHR